MTKDVATSISLISYEANNLVELLAQERKQYLVEREQSDAKTLMIEGLQRGNKELMERYNNLINSNQELAQAHANVLNANKRFEEAIEELQNSRAFWQEGHKNQALQIEECNRTIVDQRTTNNHFHTVIEEQTQTITRLNAELARAKANFNSDRKDLLEKLIREFIEAPESNPDKWAKQQLIIILVLSEIHSEMKGMRRIIQTIATPIQEALLEQST